MATIKDEILSIATEQGYEGDSPKTIAGAVNALGTVIGGGGGSDAEPLFVHFTYKSYHPDTFTADKTFEEIAEAVENERLIIGVEGTTLDRKFYQLTSFINIEGEGQNFNFTQIIAMSDKIRYRTIDGSYYNGTLTITGAVKWVNIDS